MGSAAIPACKNRQCPRFNSNQEVIILKEAPSFISFGCKACGGINVQVVNWDQATQINKYRQQGTPEYARERAFFFLGRHHR